MLIRLLLVSFTVFIAWIIYLTNTGQTDGFIVFVQHMPYGDKAGHVILSGILTLLTNLALKCRSIGFGRLRIPLGTAIISVVVLLEEFSQMYIPVRTFSGWDLLSDFIGITLFTIIALQIHRMQVHKPMHKPYGGKA